VNGVFFFKKNLVLSFPLPLLFFALLSAATLSTTIIMMLLFLFVIRVMFLLPTHTWDWMIETRRFT